MPLPSLRPFTLLETFRVRVTSVADVDALASLCFIAVGNCLETLFKNTFPARVMVRVYSPFHCRTCAFALLLSWWCLRRASTVECSWFAFCNPMIHSKSEASSVTGTWTSTTRSRLFPLVSHQSRRVSCDDAELFLSRHDAGQRSLHVHSRAVIVSVFRSRRHSNGSGFMSRSSLPSTRNGREREPSEDSFISFSCLARHLRFAPSSQVRVSSYPHI